MRIPRPFINELLARCDIVELIDARVPLRKKGSNHSACCPFHEEKTPSFTVSAAKQFYHCFGCGVSGNAISFLMQYDRLTFVEAIETLAAQLNMTVPREAGYVAPPAVTPDLYQLMEQAAHYYQRQLRVQPQAIAYLKQRGLSGQIAKEFAIGYAPAGWDCLLKQLGNSQERILQLLNVGMLVKKNEGGYYDRFRDRIMFPIRDRRGRVIAFGGRIIDAGEPKYLNSPETPIFHKGSELYGLHEVYKNSRDITRLIVVEGYMDVVALAQQGIREAVATLGTATTADHIKQLFRICPDVVFCFDGDKAGQAAAWRALEITLPLLQDGWQPRFLLLPETEDPDSLVRKEGLAQFTQRLDNAQSLADFFFTHLTPQVDLSSIEGKARLTKLAVPLLSKIPAGVLQHMLFERLAKVVRMDTETLKNITGIALPAAVPMLARSKPKSKNNPLRQSAMRLAIAFLLQNPHLAQSVPENGVLTELTLPGSELLNELITLLKQTPDLNTGALLEYWRERAEYKQLMQLASLEMNMPANGVENEFLGIIGRLQQLNREQLIEQLLQKANISGISDAEKQQLQMLIAMDKHITHDTK